MSGPLGKIDKKVSMVDLQLKEPWTFPHIEELRKWDQSLTGNLKTKALSTYYEIGMGIRTKFLDCHREMFIK